MRRYERTWPTAVLAIGVGALAGWAVFGPSSFSFTLPLLRSEATTPPPDVLERDWRGEFPVHPASRARPAPPVRPAPAARPQVPVPGPGQRLVVQRRRTWPAAIPTEKALEMLREDRMPGNRRLAAAALATNGRAGEVAGALMIAAASDPDASVRASAIQSLGRRGEPAVVPALLVAVSDTDIGVRAAAVTALSEFDTPTVLATIAGVLADDPAEHVRAQAAIILGRTGWSEARAPLERARRADVSETVRRAAVVALARLDELDGR